MFTPAQKVSRLSNTVKAIGIGGSASLSLPTPSAERCITNIRESLIDVPRGASAGEDLSDVVLRPIAKESNDSGGKLRGYQRMLEQSIESGTNQGMEAAGRNFGEACRLSCMGRRAVRLQIAGKAAGHFRREAGMGCIHCSGLRGLNVAKTMRSAREKVPATIRSEASNLCVRVAVDGQARGKKANGIKVSEASSKQFTPKLRVTRMKRFDV